MIEKLPYQRVFTDAQMEMFYQFLEAALYSVVPIIMIGAAYLLADQIIELFGKVISLFRPQKQDEEDDYNYKY